MSDICTMDERPGVELPPRDRLVRAATRLFCSRGIAATGIDAVLREAGVAKMTLYKIFGSKDRLVEAVLEEEGQRWRDWFLPALVDGPQAPRDKLDRIFPLLRQWFEQDDFYGCPFINAVGEHDKSDPRLRDLALRHKSALLDAITALAAAAGAADPVSLSHQVGLLIDGAIVAVMVTREPSLADVAGKACNAVLNEALQPAR
ncbi:MAG: TetR/AcrR family transcriptional regulator [Beijerinckiaceae bacterium]